MDFARNRDLIDNEATRDRMASHEIFRLSLHMEGVIPRPAGFAGIGKAIHDAKMMQEMMRIHRELA